MNTHHFFDVVEVIGLVKENSTMDCLMRSMLCLITSACCTFSYAQTNLDSVVTSGDVGGRYYVHMFSVADTALYMMGSYKTGSFSNECWRMNTITHQWSLLSVTVPFTSTPYGFAIGDQYYLIDNGGGGSPNNKGLTYRFNPNDNTITPQTGAQRCPAPGFLVGAYSVNDTGYCIAQYSFGNYRVYSFTPNDGWLNDSTGIAGSDAPYAFWGLQFAVGFVIEDKIYLGMGSDGTMVVGFNELYSYTPSTNDWDTLSPLPGYTRLNDIGVSTKCRGYVGLGKVPGSNYYQRDVWEYNPTNDSWSSAPAYMLDSSCSERSGAGACRVGENTVYMGFGWKNNFGTEQSNVFTFSDAICASSNIVTTPSTLDLELYPNPANSMLSINFANNSVNHIAVFDAQGRQLHIPTTNSQLDVSDLSDGIYYVEVEQQHTTGRKRFVKN